MATTPFICELEEQIASQTAVSTPRFSIEDPESVWLVKVGKLDLFAVPIRDGVAYGSHYPLLRVETGQLILGVGRHIKGVQIIANAGPGAQVVCVSQQALRDAVSQQGEQLFRLLEQWITQLTIAVSDESTVGKYVVLEPGGTINIPPPTRAVLPQQGLIWAVHQSGASIFRNGFTLGGAEYAQFLIYSGCFPVTREGWLQSAEGAELHGVSSSDLGLWDPNWDGLRRFHELAMLFLRIKMQKAAAREEASIQQRTSNDAAVFQSSLLRLASSLDPVEQIAETEHTCRHPVYLAAKVVGKKMGFELNPHPDMLRGVVVHDPVDAIARASGIRVRMVALKGKWWQQDIGPLLGFLEDNTPVAVLPRSPRAYEYYDPTKKLRVPITSESALLLNPFAYVFYRPFPARKLTFSDLLKFALPTSKRELLIVVLMGLAAGLLGILMPIATGIAFDTLIPGAERTQLMQMAVLLFAIAIATAMCNLTRSFALLRLEGKLETTTQAAIWDRLLNLPVHFFREHSSGDLAQRSLAVSSIRQILTGTTLGAMLSGIFSVFSLALLVSYSPGLAAVVAMVVTFIMLVTVACGLLLVRLQKRMIAIDGKISSLLLQILTGVSKFRISGTEGRAFSVWGREFAGKKRLATEARHISNFLFVFHTVASVLSVAVLLYCQQFLTAKAEVSSLSTGEFLAFFAAFSQFSSSMIGMGAAGVAAVGIFPLYQRARPIFDAIPEVTESKASPGRLTGAIEVSHVTFRYKPEGPPVLDDVSIRVASGQFVAIVGPSGSGKSTLLRMLLGFEAPESGAIYFDGQNLSGLDVQEVRRQMGVVLQSSRPISGSILQNIVGSSLLTAEDAWEAARLAGVDDDIRKMPMGLHTYLSDGGGGISGGQRQRLMIARAIAPRPRMLLFDEATSALDNRTQAAVSRSLEGLRATRVVIAHRLSTILNADLIVVLEKGKIVQSGTYNELMGQPGVFRDLSQRQVV